MNYQLSFYWCGRLWFLLWRKCRQKKENFYCQNVPFRFHRDALNFTTIMHYVSKHIKYSQRESIILVKSWQKTSRKEGVSYKSGLLNLRTNRINITDSVEIFYWKRMRLGIPVNKWETPVSGVYVWILANTTNKMFWPCRPNRNIFVSFNIRFQSS